MKDKVIVVDIVTIHKMMPLEQWFKLFKEQNLLLYTSLDATGTPRGDKPYSIDKEGLDDSMLVDVSTEEGRKILEEIRERTNNER